MNRIRAAMLVGVISLSPALSAAAQRTPRLPYVEHQVCEGEGCMVAFLAVVGRSVPLFSRPVPRRSTGHLRVGDTVEVKGVDIIHYRLGAVVARRPVALPGLDGAPTDTLSTGDTLRLLSYGGEGYYRAYELGVVRLVPTFWRDGRDYPDPPDTLPGILVDPGEYAAWYRVDDHRGHRGWVRGKAWIADSLFID